MVSRHTDPLTYHNSRLGLLSRQICHLEFKIYILQQGLSDEVSYRRETGKIESSLGIVPIVELKIFLRILCMFRCKDPLADSSGFPPVYDYTSIISHNSK